MRSCGLAVPVDFPSDARRPPTHEEHFVLEDLPERERMLWASVAYLFFPAAIYGARWDPFVRFHARQGVGIAIGWILGRAWQRFADANELPEVTWVGYALVAVLLCYGIRDALALEFRALPWVGRLIHRLPLPRHLAEPRPV